MTINDEKIYDEEISPLVKKVNEICKRENMPFIMSFAMTNKDSEPLYCTSTIYGKYGMIETPQIKDAVRAMATVADQRNFTITTSN